MHRTNPVIGFLLVLLATAANAATSIILVRMFWSHVLSLDIVVQGVTYSIPYSTAAIGAVPLTILLNVLSAKFRPNGWFFRWVMDFGSSLALFAVVMFIDAAIVLALQPMPGIDFLVLMVVMTVWVFVDLFVNQQKNVNDVMGSALSVQQGATVSARAANAPGPTVTPPQDVHVHQRVIIDREYFFAGPNGELIPVDDPGGDVIEHVEYYTVPEPAQIAAPAPVDGPPAATTH